MQPGFFGSGVCCSHDRAPSPVIPKTGSANHHKKPMQVPVSNQSRFSDTGHSHVSTIFDIVRRLAALNSLRDLESTFAVKQNVVCKELLDFVKEWCADVEVHVAKIPKYSDML